MKISSSFAAGVICGFTFAAFRMYRVLQRGSVLVNIDRNWSDKMKDEYGGIAIGRKNSNVAQYIDLTNTKHMSV